MASTNAMSDIRLQPYWRQSVVPRNIRDFMVARLNRRSDEMLDVHEMKEILNLRCMRFAERLFALIDVRCLGYISTEELGEFLHAFENHHIQFRLHIILHCYDPCSRGQLTLPEIKTMIMENLIEGGMDVDHHAIGYLTETMLARSKLRGPLITYQQLMEIAKYQPQFFFHLLKSKIPPKKPTGAFEMCWQCFIDAAVDYSGCLLFLSLFLFVMVIVFITGIRRHNQDDLAKILGWSHTFGRSASDVFKVLISFFALTLCNNTPFLFRNLPKTLFVRSKDVQLFRSVVLTCMLLWIAFHSFCQTINMWRLTEVDLDSSESSAVEIEAPLSFHSLLGTNVFITGLTLFFFFLTTAMYITIDNFNWPIKYGLLTKIRDYFYSDRQPTAIVLLTCGILIALHSSTTFTRTCFQLPRLSWMWLGVPTAMLALDQILFQLVDRPLRVYVVNYRIMPERGVLLTLSKPDNCSLGPLSFVQLCFPGAPVSATKSLPILSHPSEETLLILIQATDAWSKAMLHYFQALRAEEDETDTTVEFKTSAFQNARQSEEDRTPTLSQPIHQRPERLTRLNTKLVYVNHPQRIKGHGNRPAMDAERVRFCRPQAHCPGQATNFSAILEITPVTQSTAGSVRPDDSQSLSLRQSLNIHHTSITPVSNRFPDAFAIDTDTCVAQTLLRGPYNLLSDEKLNAILSYPLLFLVGHSFVSVPLVSLVHYLRMLKPMAHHTENVPLRKIILSWQVSRYEDLVWLLELLEPLHDLHSLIQLEVRVHIVQRHISKLTESSSLFYQSMESVMKDPYLLNLPLNSRVGLYFGMRDWTYQLETIRNDIQQERVGVIVDGPQSDHRQIQSWIQTNGMEQFEYDSLGIVPI